MTELKAGTRGTWDNGHFPCVLAAPTPDKYGNIVIRDELGDEYVLIEIEDFTPDPDQPTTVMVEMSVEDAIGYRDTT